MFWADEDGIDIEALRQQFEQDLAEDNLQFYSLEGLEQLFEWYLEEEQSAKAQAVLAHADTLYPNEPRLFLWRSYLASYQRQWSKAHFYIEKAFEAMPPDRAVYEQYISVCTELGRHQQAAHILLAYAEDFPEIVAEVWRFGVQAFEYVGAWEPMIWAAWRGLEEAPNEWLYFLQRLIQGYKRAQRLAEGIAAFWEQLWQVPTDFVLWLGLAVLYYEKGAYALALQALEQVWELLTLAEQVEERWWAQYYYWRGRALQALGDWDAAYQSFLWARRYAPQARPIQAALIAYYHHKQQWALAEPYVRSLIQSEWAHPTAYRLIADQLWAQGQWRLAAQFYWRLLKHAAHAEHAMERLLWHYSEWQARSGFRRCLRVASKLFADRPMLWLRWSQQALMRGQLWYAWNLIDYAVEQLFHRMAPLYYWHAALSWQVGDITKAYKSLENALLRAPQEYKLFFQGLGSPKIPLPLQKLFERYVAANRISH